MRPTPAIVAILLVIGGCGACDRAKQGAKEAINKGGEIAGQTAGEFIKGAKEGVEETFAVQVVVGPRAQALGIGTGQTRVTATDSTGNNNQLQVYLIFGQDVNDTLMVKAIDADQLEMGRAVLPVSGKKDAANWFTITFPSQTDLESKGTVAID